MSAEPEGVKFGIVGAAELRDQLYGPSLSPWMVHFFKAMDAVFPPGLEENLLEEKEREQRAAGRNVKKK